MKTYAYSVTDTMLKEYLKSGDKGLEGFNSMVYYALRNALGLNPDCVLEKIVYEKVIDACEDPVDVKCAEHRWVIYLKPLGEFVEVGTYEF